MTPPEPIRLLVVDDHPLVREGVASLMARIEDIDIVGEASTGEEAVRLVEDLQPNVVLMDLHMPGMGGIEATRTVSRRHPDIGIIVLSMLDDNDSVFAAVRAGARGYILKDAERGSLLRAIRSVAHGEALLGDVIAARVLAHLGTSSIDTCTPTLDPDIHNLTPREVEILTPHRQRLPQRRTGRTPVHQRAHRRQPHLQHLPQAPRQRPGTGHHPRPRCGPALTRTRTPGPAHPRRQRPVLLPAQDRDDARGTGGAHPHIVDSALS
jgi:DNA-binding NarL/FixJ family response regulator